MRTLSDLNTALRLDPTMPAALLTRGLWYRDDGQVEKAVADLEAFLRYAGDEWAGYRNRVREWIIELQKM